MTNPRVLGAGWLVLVGLLTGSTSAAEENNVVLVLVDGLRPQEVFAGADETLIVKEAGVDDPAGLRKEFWRDSPRERRAALLPFVWSSMAAQGRVLGDSAGGTGVTLTNSFWFSYPGYSEMFCGFADPRIDSNDPKPNANVTVFEWLHGRPGFKDQVAAFGAWDTVWAILNRDRAGFYINTGFEKVEPITTPRMELLNRLKVEIPKRWGGEPYDALTYYSAMEYLKERKPRVLLITFGETDEFGHAGQYDEYLWAARRTDGFLRDLWETLQTMPSYRGKTTMLVAGDHGRGKTLADWRDHGAKVDGSQNVWVGAIGPAVKPAKAAPAGQPNQPAESAFKLAQVAASVAAAVGEDYNAAVPKAAAPLPLGGR